MLRTDLQMNLQSGQYLCLPWTVCLSSLPFNCKLTHCILSPHYYRHKLKPVYILTSLEFYALAGPFLWCTVLMDEEGINPDELEKALKANSASRERWKPTARRPFWAMLYIIPTFHNPTGICLSPGKPSSILYCFLHALANTFLFFSLTARCKRVVELAREYDLLVVCDDVYNCLYFPDSFKDSHPPKRLFAYDDRWVANL